MQMPEAENTVSQPAPTAPPPRPRPSRWRIAARVTVNVLLVLVVLGLIAAMWLPVFLHDPSSPGRSRGMFDFP